MTTLKNKLPYLFVFKRNFFILVLLLAATAYMMSYLLDSASRDELTRIMVRLNVLTFIFCLLILVISLFTCVAPYLIFLFKKRILEKDPNEKRDIIKIFFDNVCYGAGFVPVTIRIENLRLPAMGHVRVCLIFKTVGASEDIYLTKEHRTKGRKAHTVIEGSRQIWLNNTNDHAIRCSFIYFEDMFHVFSLPYREWENMGIFTIPQRRERAAVQAMPKHTESPVVKILDNRTVPAELLNYKRFEPGDNPKRIIWPVYARSRELIVRLPDVVNPYVSHITLIPLMQDHVNAEQARPLRTLLLDHYKEQIRSILDALHRTGLTVTFRSDVASPYPVGDYETQLYRISILDFSPGRSAKEALEKFMQGKSQYTVPLVLFSSLADAQEILQAAAHGMADTRFVWIKSSHCMDPGKRKSGKARAKNLLMFEIAGPMEQALGSATGRRLRKRILGNEKKMVKELKHLPSKVIEI
jgi:hypothetical protein